MRQQVDSTFLVILCIIFPIVFESNDLAVIGGRRGPKSRKLGGVPEAHNR